MRKNLSCKILISVLALSAFNCNEPANIAAADILSDNNIYAIQNNTSAKKVIVIKDENITQNIVGDIAINSDTNYNEVTITGSTITGDVSGGESFEGSSNYNTVTINNSTIKMLTADEGGLVWGAYSEKITLSETMLS